MKQKLLFLYLGFSFTSLSQSMQIVEKEMINVKLNSCFTQQNLVAIEISSYKYLLEIKNIDRLMASLKKQTPLIELKKTNNN